MSISVIKAGLQSTLQGKARSGFRHFGVPWSGPADPLSMSLANRLVGNKADDTAIEVTLGGVKLLFSEAMAFAVTGATANIHLNRMSVEQHVTVFAEAGDVLEIGGVTKGCRNYIAVSGLINADAFLGSTSTYLPGHFGGLRGNRLKDGDDLQVRLCRFPDRMQTPEGLKPFFNDQFALQVVGGPDFEKLKTGKAIFEDDFTATARSSRMGVQIEGAMIETTNSELLTSNAVFPGSVQCPPDGKPYILLSDSQTTGGYPHILQVMRSDRFQLGQIRQGAKIRFVERTADYATESYRHRWAAYADWMPHPVI